MRAVVFAVLTLALIGCSQPPQESEAETTIVAPPNAQVSSDNNKLWVTSQYADRHSCPSEKCGVVGRLFHRESVKPVESQGDWVRITKIYDATCVNGESVYVDKGNASCSVENGIIEGKMSEWVNAKQLSRTRPADPATQQLRMSP